MPYQLRQALFVRHALCSGGRSATGADVPLGYNAVDRERHHEVELQWWSWFVVLACTYVAFSPALYGLS